MCIGRYIILWTSCLILRFALENTNFIIISKRIEKKVCLGRYICNIGAYYACLYLQTQHDHFKTIIYMIVMAICILKLMNWRELITCYRARCLS